MDLGLPIPSWRPGQGELVERVADVFSHTAIVALEAPPGVGKSIIAIAVARLLGHPALVLTGTKQLQDQYSSLFPGIVDIRGRSNYPCIAYTGETCDQGCCVVGEPCEYQFGEGRSPATILCHYYRRKAEAVFSPLVVANYAYFLADNGSFPGKLKKKTKLFILDEAHTIEDQIRGWLRVEISQRARKALGVDKLDPESLPWLQSVADKAKKWTSDHSSWAHGGWDRIDRQERRLYTSVSRLAGSLGRVVADLEENGMSWVPERFGESLAFKPVAISGHAREALFSPGEEGGTSFGVCFLLMSAALSDVVLSELGLEKNEYTRISLPSPFPIANRPAVFLPVVRVNRDLGPEGETKLVETVDKILDHHGKSKGLIHTTNYKIAKLIVMNSRHQSRLVTHEQKDRGEVLARFKNSSRPLVLISPSMTTGVDLPYDQCRFQIVAKVGWPDRGDLQVSLRSQFSGGDAWYASRTIQNLVQAYGRGVRADDDRCTFYILDETFRGLLARWRNEIPGWFLEALQTARGG